MTLEIIRSSRRTLCLEVRSANHLIVRAPYGISEARIRAFVEQEQSWIIEKQASYRALEAQWQDLPPYNEETVSQLKYLAKYDLTQRCERYAKALGLTYQRLQYRLQRSKWGSCSSKGTLSFNALLMLAPEYVRDYVVVHELCHLKELNHSSAFWTLVSQAMPDYEKSRQWLRREGRALMATFFSERG